MSVHPSSVVSPCARLGPGVSIGPFAVVEEGVVLGEGCVVEASAQIRRGSELGARCRVGAGAVVGGDPQFRDFDPDTPSGVRIGCDNVLREHVTVNRSIEEGGCTVLGDRNYLMTGAHVGHDCVLNSDNVLANNVLLGGHVLLGSHCFLGGGAVFHQFVRVGDYVMSQGISGTSLDIPPYLILAGTNLIAGLNSVGLRRAGFGREVREELKAAFREVYRGSDPLQTVLERAADREMAPETRAFYDFLGQESKKGLCMRLRS